MTPEQIRQQQADAKFDRNMKIVAGVIGVLGVAATTVMTIMETEKQVRKLMQRKSKRKTRKITGPKAPKALKAPKLPPKKKMSKFKPILDTKTLLQLEKQADKVLDMAQQLKEEVKNGGMSSSQTAE